MSSPVRAAATPADFDALAAPPRLSLGCRWDYREAFLNVDLHASHNPAFLASEECRAKNPAA